MNVQCIMPANDTIDISDVQKLLQVWDHGSKNVRARLLQTFIQQNTGKTGPELETQLNNAASLFLTRLTAWLRLSYIQGIHLGLQLRAIAIFVGSSSGHKFLTEFLEVGGILTILEILGLKDIKEEDKEEAIKLLTVVANTGRKYKELICESYGIRSIAECLAKSESAKTQDLARNLFQELAIGNPRYLNQIYKALISLLGSASPKAQQLSAITLRFVQSSIATASISIVDATLSLLRSSHVEVQFEACELIKDLVQYDVRQSVLEGLVSLLKPSLGELSKEEEASEDNKGSEIKGNKVAFIQQASAAKLIGILSKQSPELAESFVQLGAVHGLLFTLGNTEYAYSQKQAYNTVEYFVRSFPAVSDAVREAMGKPLFDKFLSNNENFCYTINAIEVDVLLNNRVNLVAATR